MFGMRESMYSSSLTIFFASVIQTLIRLPRTCGYEKELIRLGAKTISWHHCRHLSNLGASRQKIGFFKANGLNSSGFFQRLADGILSRRQGRNNKILLL